MFSTGNLKYPESSGKLERWRTMYLHTYNDCHTSTGSVFMGLFIPSLASTTATATNTTFGAMSVGNAKKRCLT